MNSQTHENEVAYSARFRAVGDLIVHQKQLNIALLPDGSYNFHPQFALVSDLLKNSDYTLANLETTIGRIGDQPYSGYPRFNTPESLLDALRSAGVGFLTLANNHILDRSVEGLMITADNVESWGFDFGGVSRTPKEKNKTIVVEINGICVGILCYTDVMNRDIRHETKADALWRADSCGVKTLCNANLTKEVQNLRDAGAQVIFALIHWGEEYQREPESDTVLCAKKLIASGVDVILGSHSHMVQPVKFLSVETDQGIIRSGLVAYSLGNFISNQTDQYTDSGIILDFTVCRHHEGDISIKDVHVVPVYCWNRDHMIQPLCSKKYLDTAPNEMDAATWLRLKESYTELRDLIDENIRMIDY